MENNLHKKDFSEADSPIPLVPTDTAWDHMRRQLDEQWPADTKKTGKRKGGFLFFSLPVGCASVLLITAVVAVLVWILWRNNTPVTFTEQSPLPGASSKSNKQAETNIYNYKESNPITHKKLFETATAPKPSKSTLTYKQYDQPVYDKGFPYAWPHITEINHPILRPLQPQQPFSPLFCFDSIARDMKSKKGLPLTAGLQWQVPLPLYGTGYYFSDPQGNTQPYRSLAPAVWLAVTKRKHRFMVEVAPLYTSLLPNTIYDTAFVSIDDSTTIRAHKQMIKTFGFRAALHYGYQLTTNFQLQASLYGTRWQRGLVQASPVNLSPKFTYSTTTGNEKKLTGFQPAAGLGIGYTHRAIEGWLQAEYPFTNTVQGIKRPVTVSLAVRWRLIKTFVNKKND